MVKRKPKSAPTPPLALTEPETQFYTNVCKFLIANNAMDGIDIYQIIQITKCWGLYRYASDKLYDDPTELIQEFESGASNVGPWYTIMERERTAFDKLAKNFGLNQRAREALIAFKVDANEPGGIISKLTAIREKAKKVV
jgi:phage terminase small subunit